MRRNSLEETILIADDNRYILGLTRRILEEAGFSVVTASNGPEALRRYQKYGSAIRLLLTDVAMPTMTGFELADRILAIDPQLPVLFMSGDLWSGYRGLKCVAKPFIASELVEQIDRLLNAKRQAEKTVPAA